MSQWRRAAGAQEGRKRDQTTPDADGSPLEVASTRSVTSQILSYKRVK